MQWKTMWMAAALGVVTMHAAAQWTLGKTTYKNAGSYSQAEMDAALGLHRGDKVTINDLQAAAQRVMNTGYFADVGVGTSGTSAALELVMTLQPLPEARMTRVGFENFVWLTPEERDRAVRKAAPLFRGKLPDVGHDAEAIQKALTEALALKGQPNATVSYETVEPTTEHPQRTVEYKAELPYVVVNGVKLQGVSDTMAPAVQATIKKINGSGYNEGLAGDTTEARILRPYLDAGYLDAKLIDPKKTLTSPGASVVGVDISATVEEGPVYRVGSIEYAGTDVAPAALLTAPAPTFGPSGAHAVIQRLKAGDIASRSVLLATLRPIDLAYRRLGYMDIVVNDGAVLDRATHTVAYHFTVLPGDQYRVAEVHVNGLDPAAQAEFDRTWTMKQGQLYDVTYVSNFLISNEKLRALARYTFGYRAVADPDQHTVVLTMTAQGAR